MDKKNNWWNYNDQKADNYDYYSASHKKMPMQAMTMQVMTI